MRYVYYRNLEVYDLEGSYVTWRDGLQFQLLLDRTNQGITDSGRVLDLASLTPLGSVPELCVLAHDTKPSAGEERAPSGRIYGAAGGDLVVLNMRGGQPLAETPTEPDILPELPIHDILVSPAYAEDNTLFVMTSDMRIFRSQDGGETWDRLQGGLPNKDSMTLDLALSPNFGQDHTLFAGGYTGDFRGEGVWRSMDAGDTWEPMWDDLTMLRVSQISVSPEYAVDGLLHAYARYTHIEPWDAGVGLFAWSAEQPAWTQVATATTESQLPQAADLYPTLATQPEPVRIADYGRSLEYTTDEGVSWQPVELDKADDHYLRQVALSPWYDEDQTVYVLGEYEIWRSTDGGTTWQPWGDPRLQGRDYSRALTTLALSPRLPDGDYRIFAGTWAGEFWSLSPSDFGGQTDEVAAGERSLLPTPTPTPLAGLTGEAPAGLYRPEGNYGNTWAADPSLQQLLGWAMTELPENIPAALQLFENGAMIWRSDTDSIYALYTDGSWESFEDTFEEGQPESDPAIVAPPSRWQPIRGFGKVWREHPEVRASLGWAIDKEFGLTAPMHRFEHGYMISFGGIAYALASGPEGNVWR
jgi:hypothetical protein